MVVTVWAVTVSQTFSVIVLLLLLCFQEFLKLVFIYVCVGSLLMLGLFSSFDEQGILSISHALASVAAEHKALGCTGLSSCGCWALESRLSSCITWA